CSARAMPGTKHLTIKKGVLDSDLSTSVTTSTVTTPTVTAPSVTAPSVTVPHCETNDDESASGLLEDEDDDWLIQHSNNIMKALEEAEQASKDDEGDGTIVEEGEVFDQYVDCI